jgi:Putative zinc-finger
MLNCKQTSQLISQSLDRKLTLRERFALQLHLMLCKYCKRFSQQVQIMRVSVMALFNSVEKDDTITMPSSAKERISNVLQNHQ